MVPSTTRLTAIARRGEGGEVTLAAPHVGRFVASVEAGQLIEAGQPIGTLHVLQRHVTVLAPGGVSGRVQPARSRQRERGVGYGEPLLVLRAASATDAELAEVAAAGEGLEPGQFYFAAPTDGLFYRAPSPEDPVFVEEGATLEPGDTIGLIEVMKFFYPVEFDGASPCRVERFVHPDATPVIGGDPLLVLSPLD